MQTIILKLMRTNHKAMTAKQVSQKLRIRCDTARRKLNQLAKFKLIKRIPTKAKIGDQEHKIVLYRGVR